MRLSAESRYVTFAEDSDEFCDVSAQLRIIERVAKPYFSPSSSLIFGSVASAQMR
jgi:hypothetical protein